MAALHQQVVHSTASNKTNTETGGTLKFKNITRWELKPELDGLLFFAQRLDELLWDYTLDTHKPMTLNAPYLCAEALDLIGNIEAELIDAANLKPVLEELLWSVQQDPIAKSLLDVPIDQYVLISDGAKLSDQKIRLDALSRTLEPFRYLHRCFDAISEQVKGVEKKALDLSIRTMVTTLVNMGVSKKSLFWRNCEFFYNSNGPKINSVDLIDDFLKLLYPFSHECVVYFIVSDLIRSVEDSLDSFDIEILSELPDELRSLADKKGFAVDRGECFVAVGSIHALDFYSAQERAVQRLDRLSDLFTIFYHQKKIAWRSTVLVQQCCMEEPFATEVSSGAMGKPFDLMPEKASKELNRLLRNIALKRSRSSYDRFNRVTDLHGIAAATDVVDNQLVMLWTSFETLVPTRATSSKINTVIDGILPFVMLSYIRRLVQRFNHDLITWRRWDAKRILNLVPDIDGPNTLHRCLALLVLDSNQSLRDQLYGDLKDFHLLRFRAFQLNQILKAPDSVKKALDMHETKLRWQIRRIYRTRNLLVHSGRRPSYINSLVENAHDYLDQALFEIMKLSCGEYRAVTLEQAFELSRIRYKGFQDRLAAVKSFDVSNCQFLCDEIDTLGDFVNDIWGADRPEGGSR